METPNNWEVKGSFKEACGRSISKPVGATSEFNKWDVKWSGEPRSSGFVA